MTTSTQIDTERTDILEMLAKHRHFLRYTVREKANGKLTTIYWDEKKQAPEVIIGDFSAIPTSPAATGEPAPEPAKN